MCGPVERTWMRSLVLMMFLVWGTGPVVAGLSPLPEGELEPIHLFKISNGVVSIGVATTGYTSEKSFRIDVSRAPNGRVYTLKIVRTQRDEGKAMPGPMVLNYKLQDLKIDPRFVVRVENPFCEEEPW